MGRNPHGVLTPKPEYKTALELVKLPAFSAPTLRFLQAFLKS
jgi:hypothetical protein